MSDIRIESLITHYQPIVDLDSGAVAGFEALSRQVAADGSVRSAVSANQIEPMLQRGFADSLQLS